MEEMGEFQRRLCSFTREKNMHRVERKIGITTVAQDLEDELRNVISGVRPPTLAIAIQVLHHRFS